MSVKPSELRRRAVMEQEGQEEASIHNLEAKQIIGNRLNRLVNTKEWQLIEELLEEHKQHIMHEIFKYRQEPLPEAQLHLMQGRLLGVAEVMNQLTVVINDGKYASEELKDKGTP